MSQKHLSNWNVKVDPHYFKNYDKRDTTPIDKALKKFNRKVKEIALFPEIQEREQFISKSERRRNKKRIGKYRKQKYTLTQQD